MAHIFEALGKSRRWFDGQPRNLRASLLVVTAFLTFGCMAVMLRTLGGTVPVVEIIFIRQLAALILMTPVYARYWHEIRTPQRLPLHLMRGFTASGAMFCGLSAVILIPLADVTAIQMTEVLFSTAFAALLLGERVSRGQWAAALVGFVGVLIMMRPFGGGFDWGNLLAVGSAMCGAMSMVAIRLGAHHDRVETVTFWQGLVVLAIVSPFTLAAWVTPNVEQVVLLCLMSLAFTVGQWLFTAGLRMGDAAAIAPLGYLRLILMAAIGWLIYAEIPSLATVLGAVLVISSAIFTIRNNARRHVDVGAGFQAQ
ncbi:RhaT Permeases of the drug/metabolite transporter (DMT) superfamily [Rhabdaerophilaceae bacterium]